MNQISHLVKKALESAYGRMEEQGAIKKGFSELANRAEKFKEKSSHAFKKISDEFTANVHGQSPLKNIRHQLESVQRKFINLSHSTRQEVAETLSKPVARSGLRVEIRVDWPSAVKSDLTVISGEFAYGLMGQASARYKEKEMDTAREVKNFLSDNAKTCHRFSTRASAAKEMVCLSKIDYGIDPGKSKGRILEAVGDTPGAIVLQVQPDTVEAGSLGFSDTCLLANLAAARELNDEARKNNIDRSITFVLPHRYKGVLQRLSELNE